MPTTWDIMFCTCSGNGISWKVIPCKKQEGIIIDLVKWLRDSYPFSESCVIHQHYLSSCQLDVGKVEKVLKSQKTIVSIFAIGCNDKNIIA
jgi:hypothetical protein